jgi:hypothetical protein
MKKLRKISISLLLIIAMLMSFASCEYVDKVKSLLDLKDDVQDVPETPDDPVDDTPPADEMVIDWEPEGDFLRRYEFCWLDTYEEVLEAIEVLRSRGNTVYSTFGFDYESELIDSRYLFMCEKENADPLEEGKDFFDRKLEGGIFIWQGVHDFEERSNTSVYYYALTIKGMYNYAVDGWEGQIDGDVLNSIDDPSGITFVYCDGTCSDPYHEESLPSSETVDFEKYRASGIWLLYNGSKFATLNLGLGFRSEYLPEEQQREFIESFVRIG